MSIEELARRRVKVVINGGCLNPAGLAAKVANLVFEKKLELKVAYVSGDDLLPKLGPDMASLGEKLPPHLDSVSPDVKVPDESLRFKSLASVPLVSANAYLGARAIVAGLRDGADIIICGRVSDASPVIGAAWYVTFQNVPKTLEGETDIDFFRYWHNWKDSDYDQLAGALVSGHLIECSAYVTGRMLIIYKRLPY